MRVSKRNTVSSGIDLSPMLDVIFQLILFFLVSTTFAMLPGISLNLPQSSTAQSSDAGGITITVEESGSMWLNDAQVDFKGLVSGLNAFDTGEKKREEFPVMVSADDKVTNGVPVMGFTRPAAIPPVRTYMTKHRKTHLYEVLPQLPHP